VGTEKRREKVVVLKELHSAIIYTRELSKQAIDRLVNNQAACKRLIATA
jgi:hypothetical protein